MQTWVEFNSSKSFLSLSLSRTLLWSWMALQISLLSFLYNFEIFKHVWHKTDDLEECNKSNINSSVTGRKLEDLEAALVRS